MTSSSLKRLSFLEPIANIVEILYLFCINNTLKKAVSQKISQMTLFKMSMFASTKVNNKSCLVTYYIDPDGFLLDEKNHYIVNNDLKNIKLSEKEIRMLRKHKILSSWFTLYFSFYDKKKINFESWNQPSLKRIFLLLLLSSFMKSTKLDDRYLLFSLSAKSLRIL